MVSKKIIGVFLGIVFLSIFIALYPDEQREKQTEISDAVELPKIFPVNYTECVDWGGEIKEIQEHVSKHGLRCQYSIPDSNFQFFEHCQVIYRGELSHIDPDDKTSPRVCSIYIYESGTKCMKESCE